MTVRIRALHPASGRAQKIETPSAAIERKESADRFNWYALCLAIVLELPPDKAMTKMSILPYKKKEDHKRVVKGVSAYTDTGRAIYILIKVCGLTLTKAGNCFGLNTGMACYAIKSFKKFGV